MTRKQLLEDMANLHGKDMTAKVRRERLLRDKEKRRERKSA